ncbi:Uncharacterised protein [Streptococcus pneumoniae]|nr:Uncharacterised protein [Streptococcus pneumoniae]CEW94059.1 Uncharacterised protein [Streptococcus pneumoniae]CEW96010.1 Uncharacterised protein [Streptococcus pneumoniae]CEY17077.1 Uncharacterised protein [Streptococcus pneumoniae]CEY54849.1 Uncharacterised protein [Streptococcus pneumoniae]
MSIITIILTTIVALEHFYIFTFLHFLFGKYCHAIRCD